MRLLISLLCACFPLFSAAAWPGILASVGLAPDAAELLIGDSEQSRNLGFGSTPATVTVRRIIDSRQPELEIYWSPEAVISHFTLPLDARVFARERWTEAPVMAGLKRDDRIYLWLAADPGPHGFERYPYLLQALLDMGITPPAHGVRLWAFFDSSYRLRADPDILASQWRRAGIAAIHVASWHFYEPQRERDRWLEKLIEACHRNAVLVYAWIELPHVSEQFWQDHPEWREKTALLGDAHLDWRKLMNLQNQDCVKEIQNGIDRLIQRFDWDGINLGELYFESLEGHSNPARFTPFNEDVRREFQKRAGVDPVELFRSHAGNAKMMRQFLDYRAELTLKIQKEWLGILSGLRKQLPHLDLVLTHVDDQFDSQMRDLLGADAKSVLPLLDQHDFIFLVEDPATVWHLGPSRYPEIAKRYEKLTDRKDRLAIDINIVERYQDVYPTRQQTGTELFQLVHLATQSFQRVALYFENSILAPDLALLPAAASPVKKWARTPDTLTVESSQDVLVRWKGPAKVNGKAWPLYDGEFIRLPAGVHAVQAGEAGPQILDINAEVIHAEITAQGILLEYKSRTRAIVRMSDKKIRVLPAGHHTVYLTVATS